MCRGIVLKPFASPELAAAQGKEKRKKKNKINTFFLFYGKKNERLNDNGL